MFFQTRFLSEYHKSSSKVVVWEEFLRFGNCSLLITGEDQCSICKMYGALMNYEIKRFVPWLRIPDKPSAPVKFTSSARLRITLQQRLQCKPLWQHILELKSSLEIDSHVVDPCLNFFVQWLQSPPFMKFFWQSNRLISINLHRMVSVITPFAIQGLVELHFSCGMMVCTSFGIRFHNFIMMIKTVASRCFLN